MKKSQYNFITRVFLIALISLISTSTIASAKYRAGYEIILKAGSDEWSIQTLSDIKEKTPIIHEFGDYQVNIRLLEITESTYTLHITVEESKNSTSQIMVISKKLQGNFTGMIEYKSDSKSNVSIEIAISIGKVLD